MLHYVCAAVPQSPPLTAASLPFSLHPCSARAALAASASSLEIHCAGKQLPPGSRPTTESSSATQRHKTANGTEILNANARRHWHWRGIMQWLWFTDCSILAVHHQRATHYFAAGRAVRWQPPKHTQPSPRARRAVDVARGCCCPGGNIRDAVFDRCQWASDADDGVGWYAHQLRDTHPLVAPPLRLHDANAPFWHNFSALLWEKPMESLRDRRWERS